jgi:single-stranded DNA-specific DHH superfamily exonuclease
MLTDKQIKEIREHLEKAQNPVFFFDNDQDGLCSFLLLQRYIERGKGVPIKSFPELDPDYFRKVSELNADYIFILDKPVISEKFWKEVEQVNVPVVWIDHHEVQIKVPDFVNYYNPIYNKNKTNEPVSALCYQISQRKEDIWIAVIGCISDKFLPDFYDKFLEKYPDLGCKVEDAFDVYYKTEIGKIGKLIGAGLKDKTTNVISMLRFLMSAKTPYEVLEESNKNFLMHKRFEHINERYQRLLKEAIESNDSSSDVLFFQYGGDLSMSSELSNELSYKFPDKFVVVMYMKGAKANISGRGKNIREKVLKIIGEIEGASGGGHEDAVGAQVKISDVELFRKRFLELVENQ